MAKGERDKTINKKNSRRWNTAGKKSKITDGLIMKDDTSKANSVIKKGGGEATKKQEIVLT